MDDIMLSYADDYRLRTYTATLQCSVSCSVDLGRLAVGAIDEEYLVCAALIDKIRDNVYDYSMIKEALRNLHEVRSRIEPQSIAGEELNLAMGRLENILTMSSRLTSKQQIHQLLQRGTNGSSSYYDKRYAVQSDARTSSRYYQQTGNTIPELDAWIPGTSTTRTDNQVATHSNSQMYI